MANIINIEDRRPRGGKYCVAGGPNNVSCTNSQHTEGVSMHNFPNANKEPERYEVWVKFVRKHRPGWNPSRTSVLCGSHFEDSCFEQNRAIAASLCMKTRLKRDSVPTLDNANQIMQIEKSPSDRERRKTMRALLSRDGNTSESMLLDTSTNSTTTDSLDANSTQNDIQTSLEEDIVAPALPMESECSSCVQLKGQVLRLQKKVSYLKKRRIQLISSIREKCDETYQSDDSDDTTYSEQQEPADCNRLEEMEAGEEEDGDSDVDWEDLEDNVDSSDSDDENNTVQNNLVSVADGTKPADEPKFVIFYNMLVAIFQLFCFNCKWEKPSVEVYRVGTMATIIQRCDHCGRVYRWKSQPTMFTKHPAGNVMLSFGIMASGSKISQTLLMFRHMGLSPRTYFYHQKRLHFPSLLHYWKTYQGSLLATLRPVEDSQWSGDGRFDSMGHSAKYGVYTMFSNSISKLVHFELLQANQSGSSNAMELDGAKQCFKLITDEGLKRHCRKCKAPMLRHPRGHCP